MEILRGPLLMLEMWAGLGNKISKKGRAREQAWASFSVVMMQRGQLLGDISSEEADLILDGKG